MSEVTEAHGPTGGATEGGPVGNEDAEQYSGYLCGVCEEPLPYGAGTCIACGTPVAPLEDEEMVAGPYVFTGPVTGEHQAITGDDPYAPADDGPVERAEFGPTTFDSADFPAAAATTEPPVADEPAPYPAGAAAGPFTPEPETAPNGSGSPHAEAAAPVLPPAPPPRIEPPRPRLAPADPAEALGLDRPPYPAPTVADPGPDPMLGRAPTAPVLSPPPPRATADPDVPPPPPGLTGRDRAEKTKPPSGPVVPLVIGATVAVLGLLALGGFIASRSNETPAATAPTTASPGPQPAPPPTDVRSRTAGQTDFSDITSRPPDVDTFCMAALQFRLDPDADSVAGKFLANTDQVVRTVVIMVHNAPSDVKPTLRPLQETIQTLATRVDAGDLRTVAEIRGSQAPAWPRFEQMVTPAMVRHCQRYL